MEASEFKIAGITIVLNEGLLTQIPKECKSISINHCIVKHLDKSVSAEFRNITKLEISNS